MSILIDEKDLPVQLTIEQAVEAAYTTELAEVASKLRRGLPALIECDKDLAPFLFINVRERLKSGGFKCVYLDGRRLQEEQTTTPMGLMGAMIAELRREVRGQGLERRVLVLPHLDLLTTSQGGLTTEAREVIPLLYENPQLVWLGFKDPSFSLPKVIENLFLHRVSLLGPPRPRLHHLVTQKESRKFGKQFNPWALYKHVSGVNAARLRKLLSTLEGEDYPADPRHAYRQLRQATLVGQLEVPSVDLDKDIGGYGKVKERLRAEILDVLTAKDRVTDAEEISRLEELIPKGMIFWGPPGTGKTLFAKAMAAAMGAAITVVSGPELKSKWVGESEENLRRIFYQARQSAPAIIVFDELDSFASARGTYQGSGVEHSMVNQLLTEMDGFHKEELVFVVGTTNFVEILDPALLRPGRFEFHLHIPYPDAPARREILKIYDKKMRLQMNDATIEAAVKRTRNDVPGAARGTKFSGDHLNALCRAIARFRLRDARKDATGPADIERALTEWIKNPPMEPAERAVVATHEAGHALCQIMTEHSPAIDRISLLDDVVGAAGYVSPAETQHKYVSTRNQWLDLICVLLAAREAEQLFLKDLSLGSSQDLEHATLMARGLVEFMGMGGDGVGVANFWSVDGDRNRRAHLSEEQRALLDRGVREILEEQRQRAIKILKENAEAVAAISELLLERNALEGRELAAALREKHPHIADRLQAKLDRAPVDLE